MPTKTFYWQLYIAAYTAIFGAAFLFFPSYVLPLIEIDPAMNDQGPFVMMTGLFLLCLTLVTFRVWQKRLEQMVIGTIILRIFIIATLGFVFASGGYFFLLPAIAVVGFGVLGTMWSLKGVNIKPYI